MLTDADLDNIEAAAQGKMLGFIGAPCVYASDTLKLVEEVRTLRKENKELKEAVEEARQTAMERDLY